MNVDLPRRQARKTNGVFAMQPMTKQTDLGLRWLNCGWRLFGRNPWLLGGMGFSCVLIVTLLTLIPIVGGAIIALLAPAFLASAYLVLDSLARQKMALPASLRVAAIKRSPLELVAVMRREDKLMPILLVSVCTMGVALLINLVVQLIAGSAWVARWSTLEILPMLGVLLVALAAVALYTGLAMVLIYSLALSVLQDEPLVPAIITGAKTLLRCPVAVLLVLAILLAPFLFGMFLSMLTPAFQYLVWILAGGLIVPIVVCSLYCSYRNLLTTRDSAAAG